MTDLRLFVAIELPPDVRATLLAAQETLAAQRLAVRWVDPNGTHLTLKFLGGVPADRVDAVVTAMTRSAQGPAPFTLHTTALGAFPGVREPSVVWLGVGGDLAALHMLRDDVESHIAPLGYPTDQRAFNPHLTLGRTANRTSPAERGAIGRAIKGTPAPPTVAWQVDAVVLMRSERLPDRARYTTIVRHGLTHPSALL